MRDPLLDIVPGYKEALEHESRIREYSFLDLPEMIGPIKVKPFTPRHFALLELKRSPFLHGIIPDVDDTIFFVWVVSEDFEYNNDVKRIALIEKLMTADIPPEGIAKECYEYLTESFYDSMNTNTEDDKIESSPQYSWVASIVNMLASNYHWSEEAILNIPFKRINQYIKCLRQQNNPKGIMFNPSDRCKSEWLANLNAGRV
jgi:hypothetical protein